MKFFLTLVLLLACTSTALAGVQFSQGKTSSGTGSSQSVVLASAPTNGDILIWWFAGDVTTRTITAPAGWTQRVAQATCGHMIYAEYAKVASSDSATVSSSTNGSIDWEVGVAEFAGQAGATVAAAFDAGPATVLCDTTAADMTIVTNSLTANVANDLPFAMFGLAPTSSAMITKPKGGWSEQLLGTKQGNKVVIEAQTRNTYISSGSDTGSVDCNSACNNSSNGAGSVGLLEFITSLSNAAGGSTSLQLMGVGGAAGSGGPNPTPQPSPSPGAVPLHVGVWSGADSRVGAFHRFYDPTDTEAQTWYNYLYSFSDSGLTYGNNYTHCPNGQSSCIAAFYWSPSYQYCQNAGFDTSVLNTNGDWQHLNGSTTTYLYVNHNLGGSGASCPQADAATGGPGGSTYAYFAYLSASNYQTAVYNALTGANYPTATGPSLFFFDNTRPQVAGNYSYSCPTPSPSGPHIGNACGQTRSNEYATDDAYRRGIGAFTDSLCGAICIPITMNFLGPGGGNGAFFPSENVDVVTKYVTQTNDKLLWTEDSFCNNNAGAPITYHAVWLANTAAIVYNETSTVKIGILLFSDGKCAGDDGNASASR